VAQQLTPAQQRMRGRFETLIGLAAPALDVLLAVGERISRIAEPEDTGYYPVRPPAEERLLDRQRGRQKPGGGAPSRGSASR
jgi:hypothetical protein